MFHPKPEQTRTAMPRGKQFSEFDDRLGGEARSVLAVLVLAALWPERFPGGWVSVDEFGRGGLYLGERLSRESLKAAVRRAVRWLSETPARLAVGTRRTTSKDPVSGRARRELDRRLRLPVRGALRAWLLSQGGELIEPGHWQAFQARVSAPAQPPSSSPMSDSIRRADYFVRRALRQTVRGSTEERRLSRAHRLLRAGLNSTTQTDADEEHHRPQ